MDDSLRQLAAKQLDLVAFWQLTDAGWSPRMIQHRAAYQCWQFVHHGVYALTQSPLTREQRWMAATLTTRDSYLSFGSAGARYGIYRWNRPYEVVTRPGNGGPRRIGDLLVYRSQTVRGNVGTIDGMRITSPERTVIDLATTATHRGARRLLREALRLELTTVQRMATAAGGNCNRRNCSVIAHLATRYSQIPYARTKSDAEALGLEALYDAGVEFPLVNVVVAGEEADMTWLSRSLIIEIDGPQYHRHRDEDLRKQRIWEAADFTVRRIPSDDVYDEPSKLVALAR